MIIAGLLEGNFRRALGGGGTLMVISASLFVIFSSLMGGFNIFGPYWPVLLILLGIWLSQLLTLRLRDKMTE